MSVEAVKLNEIKSVIYEGGEYSSPPHSAPPVNKASSYEDSVHIKGNTVKNKGENFEKHTAPPAEELMDIRSIKESIRENYEKIKEQIQTLENTELKFERDKETKRDIIKILDKKTKKVIKQIPPKEFYKFIVELYKQNKKNEEKMERKENLQSHLYNGKSDLETKGLILNRNI